MRDLTHFQLDGIHIIEKAVISRWVRLKTSAKGWNRRTVFFMFTWFCPVSRTVNNNSSYRSVVGGPGFDSGATNVQRFQRGLASPAAAAVAPSSERERIGLKPQVTVYRDISVQTIVKVPGREVWISRSKVLEILESPIWDLPRLSDKNTKIRRYLNFKDAYFNAVICKNKTNFWILNW